MSQDGKILSTAVSIAFIFIGYLALRTGATSKGLPQVGAYVIGVVLLSWGLGMIFAPEGMANITGPLLTDAYPATTTPIAQPGWTESTVNNQIMQQDNTGVAGFDLNDQFSGYSTQNMDYTFGLVPVPTI